MEQRGPKPLTVKELDQKIKNRLEDDPALLNVLVVGEVSNCSKNQENKSAHLYFTLKDESDTISCVMYSSYRGGLSFLLEDGQQVEAHGHVSIYSRRSTYQLYVDRITKAGAGALKERLQKLKQQLAEMGMFDPQYKKPIPAYVRKVGVVTAAGGAAVRDIIRTALDRNPYVQLILYPAKVQGEGAEASIARGIQILSQTDVDVIIVGRGGGSVEDLEAFDSEQVAYAIFNSTIPVISAVGHEINDSIADLVADLRVATPTAAAIAAVYKYDDLQADLDQMQARLMHLMGQDLQLKRSELETYRARLQGMNPGTRLKNNRDRLQSLKMRLKDLMTAKLTKAKNRQQTAAFRLKAGHPGNLIRTYQKQTADMEKALKSGMENRLTKEKDRYTHCLEQLEAISPSHKLSQGYSYVQRADGKAVTRTDQVAKGEALQIYVTNGVIGVTVTDIKEEDHGGRD